MRQVRFNYWAINTGPQLPFVRIDNIVVVFQWHQPDQQQQQQIIFLNKIFLTKYYNFWEKEWMNLIEPASQHKKGDSTWLKQLELTFHLSNRHEKIISKR